MSIYITAAKIAGVTSAACLSGMIANVSLMGMPAISLAPKEILVKQWNHAYNIGKSSAPPFALLSATCFGYLAHATSNLAGSQILGFSPTMLYTIAAVAIPCIVPFTLIVMAPLANNRLIELAAQAEKKGTAVTASDEEVQGLIGKWVAMNYVRAGIVGTGALIGAVAAIAM